MPRRQGSQNPIGVAGSYEWLPSAPARPWLWWGDEDFDRTGRWRQLGRGDGDAAARGVMRPLTQPHRCWSQESGGCTQQQPTQARYPPAAPFTCLPNERIDKVVGGRSGEAGAALSSDGLPQLHTHPRCCKRIRPPGRTGEPRVATKLLHPGPASCPRPPPPLPAHEGGAGRAAGAGQAMGGAGRPAAGGEGGRRGSSHALAHLHDVHERRACQCRHPPI